VFRDASAGLVVPSCELAVARVHSCWGEGEDATLRSMPSLTSLDQRRQDDRQTHPSSHTSPDEDL
jgi:hypothetical protein